MNENNIKQFKTVLIEHEERLDTGEALAMASLAKDVFFAAYWAQQQIRGRFGARIANTLGITPASSFYKLLVTDLMDSTLRETINES